MRAQGLDQLVRHRHGPRAGRTSGRGAHAAPAMAHAPSQPTCGLLPPPQFIDSTNPNAPTIRAMLDDAAGNFGGSTEAPQAGAAPHGRAPTPDALGAAAGMQQAYAQQVGRVCRRSGRVGWQIRAAAVAPCQRPRLGLPMAAPNAPRPAPEPAQHAGSSLARAEHDPRPHAGSGGRSGAAVQHRRPDAARVLDRHVQDVLLQGAARGARAGGQCSSSGGCRWRRRRLGAAALHWTADGGRAADSSCCTLRSGGGTRWNFRRPQQQQRSSMANASSSSSSSELGRTPCNQQQRLSRAQRNACLLTGKCSRALADRLTARVGLHNPRRCCAAPSATR